MAVESKPKNTTENLSGQVQGAPEVGGAKI